MNSSSPLRKAKSSGLHHHHQHHPLKSFSTSRLFSRRPPLSERTSDAQAQRTEARHSGSFFSQLKRSFTYIGGHRPSSSFSSSPGTATSAVASLDHQHPGFFSQLKRTFTLRSGHRSSSSPAAAGLDRYGHADQGKDKSASPLSDSLKDLPPAHSWGRRVKCGLIKPLQVVRDGYVDCMMGLAEDPRMEGLVGMGFQGAGYDNRMDSSRLFHSTSNNSGSTQLRRSASAASSTSSASVLMEAGYHTDDSQLETILHNKSKLLLQPIANMAPGYGGQTLYSKSIANMSGDGQTLYTKPSANKMHGYVQSLYTEPIPE